MGCKPSTQTVVDTTKNENEETEKAVEVSEVNEEPVQEIKVEDNEGK